MVYFACWHLFPGVGSATVINGWLRIAVARRLVEVQFRQSGVVLSRCCSLGYRRRRRVVATFARTVLVSTVLRAVR